MMADVARVKRNIERMIAADAPESEIDIYLKAEGVTPDQLKVGATGKNSGVAEDVAKSLPAGVARGAAGLLGSGDLREIASGAVDVLGGIFGVAPERLDTVKQVAGRASLAVPLLAPVALGPTSRQNVDVIEGIAGPLHKPQTRAGQYSHAVGEFVPNMVAPGTIPQRIITGVLAPALASEAAGQLTEGTAVETPARIAAALTGSLGATGAMQAVNSARAGVAGMSRGAGRVLEKNIGPDAETNFSRLGPEAMLLESGEDAVGIAQGISIRPGGGRGQIFDAIKQRQDGANARLAAETDATLGPAQVPSRVEASLKAQRDVAGKDYGAAVRGGQRVSVEPIVKALNNEIQLEAGIPKDTLVKIKGYLYGQDRVKNAAGEIEHKSRLKTSPAEILNVRQAVDDLIATLETGKNAHRQAVLFRSKIDEALGKAAPEVHAVDAKYAELMKQSEALERGQSVLNTGKTAIRPWELAQDMTTMSAAQKDMLVKGARAEIDRIVGTNANDVTKLRQLIQSEGDWNRDKLARLFGGDKADRIIAAIEREAVFQGNYRRIVENSQTAQRLSGQRAVAEETGKSGNLREATLTGLALRGAQKAKDLLTSAVNKGRRTSQDQELAYALTTKGRQRDELLAAIRGAQQKRFRGSTTPTNELMRLLLASQASMPQQ